MRLDKIVMGGALLALACGGNLAAPETDEVWSLDHVEESGALLSVWGSGPDDVWAAGGQTGRSLLLHNDGTSWRRVDTGATSLLWWVYGFTDSDVYAVGEDGLILHYDGASWEQVESHTHRTLYGIWGAPTGDVWIVGGDASGPEGSAVVLRGHGRSFEVVGDIPGELLPSALYKAYGYGSEEVVVVGSGGTVLRWNGDAWRREQVPTSAPLFSLWGRGPDDVYVVGGYGSAELLHYDGAEWQRLDLSLPAPGLSGVFTAPDHPTIAVGLDSYVLEILPDGTRVEPQLPWEARMPWLHGVWGDEAGSTYAVGGEVWVSPGDMTGVILRRQ